MMTETQQAPARPRFRVRKVATDRPWMWLAAGWQDMRAYPYISGAYGAALAIFGWFVLLLMFEFGLTWAILPTVAGFLIVSPLLGAGLYEVSRKRALGELVTLHDALYGFRRNGTQIAMIGAVLVVINLIWIRIAGLIFALFFGLNFTPSLADLPVRMLQSENLPGFLLVGTGFGFVLASATFAACVVSIPMLVDCEVSFLEAVTVSIQAVVENPRAMALWAGLIVLFTGLALVPFFLGLVIAMPLIGHATWHAYRDLVVEA
jgi:uncharacterized membrane protein